MSSHIILIEKVSDWKFKEFSDIVVSARDYLTQSHYSKTKEIKVINLCRNYRYLSIGYYSSLLAEARQQRVIPSVKTMLDLSKKSIYSLDTEMIEEQIRRAFLRFSPIEQGANSFDITIFFGMSSDPYWQALAREIFRDFPCPLLKIEFRRQQEHWHLAQIKPLLIHTLAHLQIPVFLEALSHYLHQRQRPVRIKSQAPYHMAVLQNPQERLAPSKARTLQKFVQVGKSLGIEVDLIERKDYSKLAEYDALFIRETTSIDNHTYLFAKKAASEGMVVVDDPDSILRCTNKVYLAELLSANRIPIPKTAIISRYNVGHIDRKISYPIVLKIPDGSFSRGVFKADNHQQLVEITMRLFKESDLLLAQEFLYTEYDWRVGIFNGIPLFACQYYMSKCHWQIIKHSQNGEYTEGIFKTWPVEAVSSNVIDVALKATNFIGDGLYGVDIKETERGACVIEINDNPNIDMGIEDQYLKDKLYYKILQEFIRRIDQRRWPHPTSQANRFRIPSYQPKPYALETL